MHKVSLTYPSGASSEEGDRYSFVEIKREKVGGEERERKRKEEKCTKRTRGDRNIKRRKKRKYSISAVKQLHYITAVQH